MDLLQIKLLPPPLSISFALSLPPLSFSLLSLSLFTHPQKLLKHMIKSDIYHFGNPL